MRRRPYQINDSHFEVQTWAGAWFAREEWTQIDRRGEKEDEFEMHGPFATEAQAQAEVDRRKSL